MVVCWISVFNPFFLFYNTEPAETGSLFHHRGTSESFAVCFGDNQVPLVGAAQQVKDCRAG